MTFLPHFVQNELDAGDTDLAKRLSAFNFCDPFDHILPFADGTIDAGNRAHLWGMYSGIPVDGSEEKITKSFPFISNNMGTLSMRS